MKTCLHNTVCEAAYFISTLEIEGRKLHAYKLKFILNYR